MMNLTPTQKKILLLIFVIIIIFVLFKTSEGFVTSTEAVNNIASVYNAGTLTATNINATGKITAPLIESPHVDTPWLSANAISQEGFYLNCGGNVGSLGIVYPLIANNITANDITANNVTANGSLYAKNLTAANATLSNSMTILPTLNEPTLTWNIQDSIGPWASRTGCGGLMNGNMLPGTMRSFLLYIAGGDLSWNEVVMIGQGGKYILKSTLYGDVKTYVTYGTFAV